MSTNVSYKTLLIQAKELMGQAGLIAYDRAKILVEVFNDRDFRAEQGNACDLRCAEILDDFCGDLALKFMRLKQLLEYFPEREQWASGNLTRMQAEMMTIVAQREREIRESRIRVAKRPASKDEKSSRQQLRGTESVNADDITSGVVSDVDQSEEDTELEDPPMQKDENQERFERVHAEFWNLSKARKYELLGSARMLKFLADNPDAPVRPAPSMVI